MTGTYAIKTNRHWYDLVSFHDIPVKFQSDFDYVQDDDRFSQRFFRYRGNWYDVNEFMSFRPWQAASNQIDRQDIMSTWHAYQGDSYFSGIVIRYDPEFERVQVGTYYC